MRSLSRVLGVLLLGLALLFPALAADEKNEAKKDDAKAAAAKDKKADAKAKKEPAKADGKKTTAAKDKDRGPEPDEEEKLVWGREVAGKIKEVDANSQRDFTLEIQVIDPAKVLEFNRWKLQQRPRTPQERANMQRELIRRSQQLYGWKEVLLRAADNAKVRSLGPPVEFDEKGNLKRWTAKELAALRGKSRLPGYPSDFSAIRPGQIVKIYLPKAKGRGKTGGAYTAKDLLDDDANEPGLSRPEVVMILIMREAPAR